MKISKRKKALRRARALVPVVIDICPNCGLPGSHFAPPSLGEPGFYFCKREGGGE